MLLASRYIRGTLYAAALLLLGGCGFFDSVGDHMPVLGDRCEYWQCFTQYGQEQSNLIKEREHGASSDSSGSAAPQVPSEQLPAAPAAQAPQTSGAPTPYDMTPEQLQSLPPPAVP
jgi:hypothetical protein